MTFTAFDLTMIGVGVFLILLMLANEWEWPAFGALAILTALIVFWVKPPISEFFARPDWGTLLLTWGVGYVAAGAALAMVKWVQYSRTRAAEYQQELAKWEAGRARRVNALKREIDALNTKLNNGRALAQASDLVADETALTQELDAAMKSLKFELETTFVGIAPRFRAGEHQYARSYGVISVVQLETGELKTEVDTGGLIRLVAKWMAWWPAYAILIIVNDALYELSRAFTRLFSGAFLRIANFFFRL